MCRRVKKARDAGPKLQEEHDVADEEFYEKLSKVCDNSVLVYMVRTIRDALNEKIVSFDEAIGQSSSLANQSNKVK